MTQLVTRLNNLATAVATQIKSLNIKVGDITTLNTTAKTNLVVSLNELKGNITALQAYSPIDDTTAGTSKAYSSSKTVSLIAAKTEINDAANTTTNTLSASKINSNIANAVAAKTQISDTTQRSDSNSSSVTYSAAKIVDLITANVNGILNGAPTVLDTLKELADAIGDDANFAATMTAALGNRLRIDAAQSLTAAQQAQGKANLDAYGNAEIGAYDTDFVATFNAGLV